MMVLADAPSASAPGILSCISIFSWGCKMTGNIHRTGVTALLAVCAYAQVANQTALVGNVIDATGRAVAAAAVSAVNTGTGDTYNTTTNDDGFYSIQSIRNGTYEITIQQPGFQTFKAIKVEVDTNQTVRTDVTLRVGNDRHAGCRRSSTERPRPTAPGDHHGRRNSGVESNQRCAAGTGLHRCRHA
jgi:hypothetical protein